MVSESQGSFKFEGIEEEGRKRKEWLEVCGTQSLLISSVLTNG